MMAVYLTLWHVRRREVFPCLDLAQMLDLAVSILGRAPIMNTYAVVHVIYLVWLGASRWWRNQLSPTTLSGGISAASAVPVLNLGLTVTPIRLLIRPPIPIRSPSSFTIMGIHAMHLLNSCGNYVPCDSSNLCSQIFFEWMLLVQYAPSNKMFVDEPVWTKLCTSQ